MNPLLVQNTTTGASTCYSSKLTDATKCYLTLKKESTYNYVTMDWMVITNNTATDYAKTVMRDGPGDVKIGLKGFHFNFFNSIKVSQQILDFYV
jgi:hypothetical protein